MKKRVLTLALVLAMCLSLAIPAFAADDSADDGKDPVATESVKPEDQAPESSKPAEGEDKDPEPSNSAEGEDKNPEPSESVEGGDENNEPAPAFTDVPEGVYYEKPVAWAVEKKITNGTEPTKFDPELTCSQVQILTFLYRAVQSAEDPSFTPAASDMSDAVLWAREKGMIGEDFENNKDCTRATAASYIWQAFDSPEVELSDQFTDVDEADLAAVSWMLAKKITDGDGSDTIFSPNKTCTRGQIVTLLYRAYQAAEPDTPVEPAE